MTEQVTGVASFLHDGRARTILEAILWHGGEAEAAKKGFANLPESSRNDLLAFLVADVAECACVSLPE